MRDVKRGLWDRRKEEWLSLDGVAGVESSGLGIRNGGLLSRTFDNVLRAVVNALRAVVPTWLHPALHATSWKNRSCNVIESMACMRG